MGGGGDGRRVGDQRMKYFMFEMIPPCVFSQCSQSKQECQVLFRTPVHLLFSKPPITSDSIFLPPPHI